MIELVSTPYKNRTEDTSSDAALKWLMANNPLYFKFQRKDIGVFQVKRYEVANPLTLIYVEGIIDVSIGDKFSIYGNSGIEDGEYAIQDTGVSVYFTDKTYIIIDTEFTYGTQLFYGGYVNYLENYFADIYLYDRNTGTYFSVNDTDATLLNQQKARPNSTGLMSIDFSGFVKSLFDYGNDFDYSLSNGKDAYMSKRFALYVRENYTNSSELIQFVDYFTVVNGAKQIQNKYGAAIPDYCYDPTRDLTEKAKFLTLYKPKYFEGYPFSLSFINLGLGDVSEIQEGLVAKLIKRETVNGVDYDTELETVGVTDSVNYLTLTGGYPSSVNKIYIMLRQDGTIYNDEAYVEPDYVDIGYVDEAVTDTLADIDLTETLQININQECIEHPIYIRWLNSLPGWNYWLFSGNNFTRSNVDDSETFEPTIEDISVATGTIEYLQRNNENSIILGAENLDSNDKQLVVSAAMSRKVQLYDEDNDSWIDVLISSGVYDVNEARETRSSVQLELRLPKTYLQ